MNRYRWLLTVFFILTLSGCATKGEPPLPPPVSQNPRIQYLIDQLQAKEVGHRIHAAETLGRLKATEAVPALIEAVISEDWGVRLSAAMALGDIGEAADAAVPTLGNALQDENPSVRSGAAWALGRIGKPAKSAVSALVAALNDESALTRLNAAHALGRIGVDAKAAVPALQQARRDEDAKVRQAAGEALKKIEPSNQKQ
jgi:HEAT repeat protein